MGNHRGLYRLTKDFRHSNQAGTHNSQMAIRNNKDNQTSGSRQLHHPIASHHRDSKSAFSTQGSNPQLAATT
ncbi:hypothetical protein [Desulforamulus hydrothermalis]